MYVLVFAFPTTALDNNSNTQKKKKRKENKNLKRVTSRGSE